MTLLILAWFGGFSIFYYSIPTHVLDDKTTTQAIVVLTGGRERLKTGYQLLSAKRADVIFISGVNPEENLKSLFKLLETSKVIQKEDRAYLASTTYLGFEANNTKENAQETAAWVNQKNITSLRLVTAAYHMPRSLYEIKHMLPEITIIPHPVFPHGFNKSQWWENANIFSLIVSEYNKFLGAILRTHFPFVWYIFERPPLKLKDPSKIN